MRMDDRLTKGFISGLIAGLIMDLVHVALYFLDINELTFFDWAGVIVLGHKAEGMSEFILGVGAQIFFAGALGIIFAYLIPTIGSKNIVLKGWIFGLFSWFFLNAIAVLYHVKSLVPRHFPTAAVDVVSVSIYGIILAYVFQRLQVKIKN